VRACFRRASPASTAQDRQVLMHAPPSARDEDSAADDSKGTQSSSSRADAGRDAGGRASAAPYVRSSSERDAHDACQHSSLCAYEHETPLPGSDNTPTSWQAGSQQPAQAHAPSQQPPSLFDQLGPHPMSSLDAQRRSAVSHALAGQDEQRGAAALSGDSDAALSAAGTDSPVCSSPSHASCAPSPDWPASAHAPAQVHGQQPTGRGHHSQGLLPPVLPRYRSSPLRTPGRRPRGAPASRVNHQLWRQSADAAVMRTAEDSVSPSHLTSSLDTQQPSGHHQHTSCSAVLPSIPRVARQHATACAPGHAVLAEQAQLPLRRPALRSSTLQPGTLLESVPELVRSLLQPPLL
jgi:hypothetical protein